MTESASGGADSSLDLRAVSLDAAETSHRAVHGTDFTEAKEAVVDALVRLTEQHCTGEGADGEVIYGVRPSSKLVSAFLLPRYDRTGTEDETSDIHIATMGVDLQIAADTPGIVTVAPELSVYIRELPSWEEIADPRNDMMPQVQLSRLARQMVEQRARSYIDERIGELPPLDDDEEEAERAGNALARAERAHELADIGVGASDAGGTPEEVGLARASAETAEREERGAAAHQARSRQRAGRRNERNATIAAIRREAFDRAFRELGIFIIAPGGEAQRPLSSGDLEETPRSELVEAGLEDIATTTVEGESAGSDVSEEEGPPPATGAIGALRSGAGRIADQFAAQQPIPQKWRRLALSLGEFSFDIADDGARERATDEFATALRIRITDALTAWLATEEGQRDAYRPNERVLPSHFADEASWSNYLSSLRARRRAIVDDVRPDITGVTLVVDLDTDFSDASRQNLRIALQNDSSMPGGADSSAFEHAIFQVAVQVTLPCEVHRPLRLDRVKPSYRFRDWLEYPAMGLNCGVRQVSGEAGTIVVRTTWAPRYAQPRIEPRTIAGVPTAYVDLAREDSDPGQLLALPDEYDTWIESQRSLDAGAGLDAEAAEQEQRSHALDIEAYRRESGYIRAGINLLQQSRAAFLELRSSPPGEAQQRASLTRRAAPWIAWIRTNEAFAAYGGQRYTDWRLFQLAFILAHIPTLASRTPEYEDQFDAFRDELSASLLYFPTGGGKSEAFFGLLIFNVFFDRLRGKGRGVTALVRYPLRLLTLQQARRLTRILVQAELVRLRYKIPGWPFEIGFWVGSGNTPNRVKQGFGGVPSVTVAAHPDDSALLNPSQAATDAAKKERRRAARYKEVLESYDKLRKCPCCGAETGMRQYPSQHGRIGIVCFNDVDCDWNRSNPPAPHRVPLPFLLTDDTIYQRAPSVVLGTIDKLALIGQHDRTINAIVGMLGAARYLDPQNGHLFTPRGARALAKAEDDGWIRLAPAFSGGRVVFSDPYPSLIIQDEGHLLDESLGTFSGLFETTLETMLTRLGRGLLRSRVSQWRAAGGTPRPRLAKVIAATATISDPDRQLRVLYQREPLRFPCPGPNLYESFYAAPREPRDERRRTFAHTLAPFQRPELSAPRMRSYVSIMTNGRSHTMTTSVVVSAYHLAFTKLWQLIERGEHLSAAERIIQALTPDDSVTALRADALRGVAAAPNGRAVLAGLLDLLRISLTYVTNKKGGDQIIETLAAQVDRDQRSEGITDIPFTTDLISGGVTIAEIQDIMARAEDSATPGAAFPPLGASLRNIVATSAISHGVDVDKFNAMFFAGLPADIAEYIQASSRIGRTHVGFSLFVPTPHSRRDRYVVETHDQFHRFLERMIPPPAVQRWADRAIRRIIPSVLQAFLCGVIEQELFASVNDGDKQSARTFTTAASIKAWADRFAGGGAPAAIRAVRDFAVEAIGVAGRGDSAVGATIHAEHYERLVEDRMRDVVERFTARADASQLSSFWQMQESPTFRRPMTSLRDVDAGGVILGATRDPYRGRNVHLETVRHVMRVIRGQRLAVRSDMDVDPQPVDTEDR